MSFIAQADDVAIFSLTPVGLQVLIEIVYKYSCNWRFMHNVTKTKIMVFGESKGHFQKLSPSRQWYLGKSAISQVCSYKHLGINVSSTGCSNDKISEASRKCKASFMSLVGAGVRPNGLNPLTCSKLLKVIVLPRCLYGCELWHQLPKSCSLQLERMLRFCC